MFGKRKIYIIIATNLKCYFRCFTFPDEDINKYDLGHHFGKKKIDVSAVSKFNEAKIEILAFAG